MQIPELLQDPPRLFSVMPFWFWNDTLDEAEIIRQIEDFEAHRETEEFKKEEALKLSASCFIITWRERRDLNPRSSA
jgi:hypothetical protein